jgi:hypothetical protein
MIIQQLSTDWRNKKISSASKVVRLLFAQRFITIFNCRYHTSNHLSVCHKPTSLSPINCQSVDNCCIIINTLINHHDPKIVINRCANRSRTTFDAEELSCYGLFGTNHDWSWINYKYSFYPSFIILNTTKTEM